MSNTQHESHAKSEPSFTRKGPFGAPRAVPSTPEPHGGETTAITPHDDVLLDTECEVIAIGHAHFYLRYADWLPPLADDEFAGLRASIQEHGIQQPVVVYRLLNNHFDVIDGLHRLRVAAELGLDLAQVPLNILDSKTSIKEQKALAWSLNADRRHLTKEQRQARALELRKQGLSYRAIGEQLGVDPKTAHADVKAATVENSTVQLPERVVSKDGKSRPATAPAPSANEIQIAREFIIDALRKKYSPLARGQLYRDASRIAGASGIKRKAFDAALDAMLQAGSVREHVNAHGMREYHFADVVERLEQRAAGAGEQDSPTCRICGAATDGDTLCDRCIDAEWDRKVAAAERAIEDALGNPDDTRPPDESIPAGMSVEDYNRAAEIVAYNELIRADIEARIEARLAAAAQTETSETPPPPAAAGPEPTTAEDEPPVDVKLAVFRHFARHAVQNIGKLNEWDYKRVDWSQTTPGQRDGISSLISELTAGIALLGQVLAGIAQELERAQSGASHPDHS